MNQVLENHKLLKLSPDEMDINSPIADKEIEFVIKKIPQRNLQAQRVSLENTI